MPYVFTTGHADFFASEHADRRFWPVVLASQPEENDTYRCHYWPRAGLVDPDRLPFVQLRARNALRALEAARWVTGAHVESVTNLTPHGHP